MNPPDRSMDAGQMYEKPALFAQLLQFAAVGHTLWDARTDEGRVGDCGFIIGGRFTKLFNVFEDNKDLGISPKSRGLDKRNIKKITSANIDGPLWSASEHTLDLGIEVGTAPLMSFPSHIKLVLNAEVKTQSSQAAFMQFCGSKRTTSEYPETGRLESYLLDHASAIVKYYAPIYNRNLTVNHLVIVHHSTASPAFVGGITSLSSVGQNMQAQAGTGGKEAPRASAHVKVVHEHIHPWQKTHGGFDAQARVQDTSEESYFNVVLRVVKYRRRLRDRWPLSMALSVRSKVTSFVRGVPGLKSSAKPAVGKTRTLSPTPPKTKSRRDSFASDVTGTVVASETASVPADTPEQDLDDARSDRSSISEQALIASEPRIAVQSDLLDDVLDAVLQRDQSIKGVVGNWNVLAAYFAAHGEFPADWERMLNLEIETLSLKAGEIARLIGISPTENTKPARAEHVLEGIPEAAEGGGEPSAPADASAVGGSVA